MPAYWLTYTPREEGRTRGMPIEQLEGMLRRFNGNPSNSSEWWRIKAHKKARVGDRVFLFQQGNSKRGVFGAGHIIGEPELRTSDTEQGAKQWHVPIRFDGLVDPRVSFLLELHEIEDIAPPNLINAPASGNSIDESVASEFEKRLRPEAFTRPIASDQADDPAFDPESVGDLRERALRAISIRRGQPAFRAALLKAYGGRCAVTGCAVEDVLEAAHIYPHKGPLTDHVSNGLLLRADVHTLFDCDLLAIDPDKRLVVVSKKLETSSYAKLGGRPLRFPRDAAKGPSKKNLARRFAQFNSIEQQCG